MDKLWQRFLEVEPSFFHEEWMHNVGRCLPKLSDCKSLDSSTANMVRNVASLLWCCVELMYAFRDRYVATLSLSLYFFNLLPLPYLDGSTALDAFLDIVLPPSTSISRSETDDLEEGNFGARPNRSPWTTIVGGAAMSRKRIADVVRGTTVALCAACAVLGGLRVVVGR